MRHCPPRRGGSDSTVTRTHRVVGEALSPRLSMQDSVALAMLRSCIDVGECFLTSPRRAASAQLAPARWPISCTTAPSPSLGAPTGYRSQMVLAEVFSMGIKAGVEPLAPMGSRAYRRQWAPAHARPPL